MDVMWWVGVIVLGLFLVAALSVGKKKRHQDQALPKDAYVSKPFLTQRERRFFHQARGCIPKGDLFMAQVRVVDLVEVNKKYGANARLRLALFRKVSQWHCDFVWLDAQLNIKAVVELDDASHQRRDRIKRDAVFNQVMAQAGIRLLRVNSFTEFARQASSLPA